MRDKILGIPIAVIVGILLIGSATALLVKYYSNTVTHTIDVSSPLEMTGDTELSLSIYGGEDIFYGVTTKNLANVSVDSYPITMITGPGIWNGDELSEVILQDPFGTYNVLSLGLLYIVKDDGTLIPFIDAYTLNTDVIKLYVDKTGTGTLSKYTRSIGFNEQNNVTIKTNPAMMPGLYTIRSCQLFDWSGTCV